MFSRLSALLLAVTLVTAAPQTTRADDDARPFTGTIGYATVSASPLPLGYTHVSGTVSGKLTVLGKFTGTVEYIIAPNGSYTGLATKIDARGNKLYESLIGQFNATGSTGTIKVVGGTGKFHEATGHSTFVSTWIIPGVTATVAINGVIELDD